MAAPVTKSFENMSKTGQCCHFVLGKLAHALFHNVFSVNILNKTRVRSDE